jgi:hypothetical protein
MAFNNGPRLVTTGLSLMLDAADKNSYPGSGTTWNDTSGNNNTGIITGSFTYSSSYYGGLVSTNTSSAILFPTSSLAYGSNSFTVELTFSPSTINGIHYLASKNSGSFPVWNLYLSGSGGSGKLYSEFRYTSAISASSTASYTFTTGSVYDIAVVPNIQGAITFFYSNGTFINTGLPTGSATSYTGSLSTGSFLLGAANTGSTSQGFIGSFYIVKAYTAAFGTSKVVTNYIIPQVRFNLPRIQPIAQVGLDSDYQAVLARATALGYALPNATQQIIDSNLITRLKACGYWSILGDFYVYANPTSRQFASLNWKRPTVAINIPAGFTWTPGIGFTGNGTQRTDMFYSSSFAANNSSFMFWSYNSDPQVVFRDGYDSFGNKIGNTNSVQVTFGKSFGANLTGPGLKIVSVLSNTGYAYNNNIFSTAATSDGNAFNPDGLWRGGTVGSYDTYSTSTLSFVGFGSAVISQGVDIYDALSQYINYVT